MKPTLTLDGDSELLCGGTYTLTISEISGVDGTLVSYIIHWGDDEDDTVVPGTVSLPHNEQHVYGRDWIGRGCARVITVDVVVEKDGEQQTFDECIRWLVVMIHTDYLQFDQVLEKNRWGLDGYP